MLYRLVLLLLLGILLLATTIDRKEQRLENLLEAHIDATLSDVKALEKQPNLKRFVQLRQQILSLDWMFAPLILEVSSTAINDNKFKVGQEDCYRQVGLLQLWEKELREEKTIRTRDFETFYSFLESLKRLTKIHSWQETDVLAALFLDHYDLYSQMLTGSYHFQTKQVLKDYQKVLKFHLLVLENINREKIFEDQYKALLYYIGKQKFEKLDRITLLKKYIQPIHNQFIELIGSNRIGWANHLNLEQDFFSGNWLEASDFIDIDENLDQEKLANLGQLLFFDPLLSGNDKRTCASCHQPQKAFSDGRSTSLGFDYLSKLDKNSPSLINSVFNHHFGHDLSKQSLAAQIDFVVHQEQEFRTTYAEIIKKLNSSPEYIQLFQDCFREKGGIDSIQINQALEGYMSTLVSFDSSFDRFMRGEQTIGEDAIKGYNLFMGKAECGTCHQAPLFSGMNSVYSEKVQYYLCDKDSKVKTPTVRNLSFTMPYFHQGTINSQKELYDIIFNTVKQNIHPNKILTTKEQSYIINFLGSLQDKSTVKFSIPKRLPKINKSLNKMERRTGGVY